MKNIALLAMAIILAALLAGCAGGDESPPVISEIGASGITASTATITWTTDELAASQVEYGLTTSYGSTTPLDSTLVTSHSVSLSQLDPSTTYHYRVKSKDESGNEAVSADYNFATSEIFSDENLEAAVREAIGKPEGPIYTSDLAGLTSLDAPEGNITDITGLEYCHNLTGLWLGNNQISDLSPLSGLASLTALDLSGNRISDVSPLSGLTSLDWLNLEDNQISDLSPLSGLTNLTDLWLSYNQISDLSPLLELTNLTVLHLWDNPLSVESLYTLILQLVAMGVEVLYDAL